MVKCPHYDCSDSDKEFESESTMRQHHTKVHNKRLPNCECENCDELFYHKSGTRSYCDECKDEINKGENNPNYSGGKKKTQCRECSSEFEYYESEKEGIFCSDCVENGSNVKTSTRFGFENGIKPSVAGRISSKSYSNKKSKVKRNKKQEVESKQNYIVLYVELNIMNMFGDLEADNQKILSVVETVWTN